MSPDPTPPLVPSQCADCGRATGALPPAAASVPTTCATCLKGHRELDAQEAREFLPFMERFRAPVLDGVKTLTTRSRAYGKPGDLLNTPFGIVRLVEVRQERLGVIARDHWREEGVASPEEFVAIWNTIHQRRRFNPDDVRVLHRFEVVR